MKANIVTRLDKLNRRLPPTWKELLALIPSAGQRMSQAELDALLGSGRGDDSAGQLDPWDEWFERNLPRIWAVWDAKFPGWQDAPFWNERKAAGENEIADNEER